MKSANISLESPFVGKQTGSRSCLGMCLSVWVGWWMNVDCLVSCLCVCLCMFRASRGLFLFDIWGKMLFAEWLKRLSVVRFMKSCAFLSTSPHWKLYLLIFLVKKQSRVCDLGAACILLHYSFLCFSMGEVYASLIKSVSHSGGFYSVARMEGGEERGRGRREVGERGRERVPDLTFLGDACNSCAAGSAVVLKRSLLHGNQRCHRIILGTPLERLLLLLLFKQYCLLCNIRLDASSGCIFSIKFVASPRRLDRTWIIKLKESKHATNFMYFCTRKHSYERALV